MCYGPWDENAVPRSVTRMPTSTASTPPPSRQHEQRILSDNLPTDLADEINLVRVAIARCLEALESKAQERDIETELAILRTINLGALSINSLLRTRLMLARGFGSLPADLMPPAASDHPDAAGKDGADHEPL